jgi:hypothetical protein
VNVAGGVNAQLKVPALVAGMMAGADSIEFELLREHHFTTRAQARRPRRPSSRSTTLRGAIPPARCCPRSPSPLLANIALHVLARRGRTMGVGWGAGEVLRRLRHPVSDEGTRRAGAELAGAVLAGLGLQLHPGKSGIVHHARGGQGFDFLGFHHRKVELWRRRGRFHLQRWPSQRAMGVLRDKIRAATDRRSVGRLLAPWSPTSTHTAGLVGVLPLRQLGREVLHDRQLRPRAPRDLRQSQARHPRPTNGANATTAPGSPDSGCSACPRTSAGWQRMPAGERCR